MMERLIRSALAASLAMFATLKLLEPHGAWCAIPWWLYYGAAAIELGLVVALVRARTTRPAIACIIFFIGAMLLALFVKGDCGCGGGAFTMDRAVRMMLACVGGMASTGLVLLRTSDGWEERHGLG